MYDLIIVGCGPAGMTAAIYARRAGKNVLVFEAKAYGGQIANASVVENYPGVEKTTGFELATKMYEQIKKLGAEVKFEMVKRITKDKKVITDNNEYSAKAIILATGAENRRLNLPNEVEFIGKGVSYCASCDGNFFKGKDVAVVGGGNTALEDANYLASLCNKVYLIHRRESFRGDDSLVNEIKADNNVEVIMNSNVIALEGDEVLNSIVVEDSEGNSRKLDISGLFIAVGQQPKNELFADVIELTEKGYIDTKDGVHTNIDGIYVAGDTREKTLRQLTTAVSDGSIAATTAIKEMEK